MKSTSTSTVTVKSLTASIVEGVKNIKSTQEWAEMLKFQSGMWHQYSFCNRILIYLQSEGKATKVAGYKAWQSKGYNVKKGEKSLKILAPMFKKEVNEETGKEEKTLVGYKTVSVFDVAQTTCEKVPSVWKRTEGEDEKAVSLQEVIKALPYVRPCSEEAHEEGSYHTLTGEIQVKYSHKANQFAETFLHEYCHKMIHEDLKEVPALKNLDHAMEEIVVESSAYILCSLAGIDVSESCFSYVACWLNNGNKEDKEIEKSLSEIEKVVNTAAKSLKAQGIEIIPEVEEEVEAE